jgi:hypothetical protein
MSNHVHLIAKMAMDPEIEETASCERMGTLKMAQKLAMALGEAR